jgi:cellulose synthase/poly-beta-1,6-N-acetylglucosamine synthase-like glycosyltransferase
VFNRLKITSTNHWKYLKKNEIEKKRKGIMTFEVYILYFIFSTWVFVPWYMIKQVPLSFLLLDHLAWWTWQYSVPNQPLLHWQTQDDRGSTLQSMNVEF